MKEKTFTRRQFLMAEQGMKFTDYHSNGAVCTPTRAALLTGRYQQRCGLEGVIYAKGETRQCGMPLEEITFAEVLKSAGYHTGIFGKWHLGYQVKYNPLEQGFEEFRGYVSGNVDYHSHVDGAGYRDWWHNREQVVEEGYTTDLITQHAVEFIKKHQDEPFCLYVAHEAPHFPFQGRHDPPDRLPGGKFPAHGSRKDSKNAYKEMIMALDESVGQVISIVKELGIEKDTFIFFCSDNGAILKVGSNGNLRGAKGSLWEGGQLQE